MSTDPTPTSRVYPPTARFAGSNSDRQSVGKPGHCEKCAEHGHIKAHPNLGCGDVGCTSAHDDSTDAGLLREQDPAQGGLTEAERHALGCFCWRTDDRWHHGRRCPVPAVEQIKADAYAAGLAARGGTVEIDREVSCDDCGHLAQRHWRPGGCHGTQGSNASKCRCNKGRVE